MSLSAQELGRDAAIAPKLIAAKVAAEKWARASRDGVAVWEVGAELLSELWENWCSCLRMDEWRADPELLGTLDGISHTAAAAAAKQARRDYREPL